MRLLRSRWIRALATGSALGLVMTVGPLATPAHAETAPSCVDWWTTGNFLWKTFHIYNGCETKQRLKIIINWHADSGCETVQAGTEWQYGVPGQSTIDTVETC